MKKFNPDKSGIYDAYREPNHVVSILIGIAWIIAFVVTLWWLLERSYR